MRYLITICLLTTLLQATTFTSRIYQGGWSSLRDSGLVEFTITPDSTKSGKRKPVECIYAIDISTKTEQNQRQEFVEGANKVIDALHDGDYIGIITYGEFARTILPLTVLTAENRNTLKSTLASLDNEKGRSYKALFQKVTNEFSLYEGRNTVDNVLIMTTTGKEKEPTSLKELLALVDNRFRIITVGSGNEYDEDLLISLAKKSLGRAYYIDPNEGKQIIPTLAQVGNILAKPNIISGVLETSLPTLFKTGPCPGLVLYTLLKLLSELFSVVATVSKDLYVGLRESVFCVSLGDFFKT